MRDFDINKAFGKPCDRPDLLLLFKSVNRIAVFVSRLSNMFLNAFPHYLFYFGLGVAFSSRLRQRVYSIPSRVMIKPKTLNLVVTAFHSSMLYLRGSSDDLLAPNGNRIMCPSWMAWIPSNCCFCKLSL